MSNADQENQSPVSQAYRVPIGDDELFLDATKYDGRSRLFIRRYLQFFEVVAVVAMLCMGYLCYEATTPAQGAGMFVDVVSGDIFSVTGKNSF